MLGGAVPLPSVFEPIADLRRGKTGVLRELSLLARRRVRIGGVPIPQDAPGLLFEAVRHLLAIPDGTRQRKLAAHTILACKAHDERVNPSGSFIIHIYMYERKGNFVI